MKCQCGGDTYVVDTRPGEMNTVRRRRQCEICERRVTTWESRYNPRQILKERAAKAQLAKRWYHELSPEAKAARNKRYRLRAAARAEAKEKRRPVAEVYKEYGCE